MLYYVFSGPLSLRAYVPEIKFNNNAGPLRMGLDWACIAVDTARGSDATPPTNHMTAIICLCVTHQKTTRRLSRRRRTITKMLAIFHRMLDWFRSLFWKEEMELTLVGLQYSGKTTFVNVIAVR